MKTRPFAHQWKVNPVLYWGSHAVNELPECANNSLSQVWDIFFLSSNSLE